MKFRIKLLEASGISEYGKMQAFNNGTRRENVKACGDDKLIRYQAICKNNGFTSALAQIEAEMQRRGLLTSGNSNNSNSTASTVTSTSTNATTPATSTTSTSTTDDLPPILDLLNSLESLVPDIMNKLRQANSTDKLARIATAINGYLDLLVLYFIVAVLSKYKTAQTIFKGALQAHYNIDIIPYMQEALKDPACRQRFSELINKYNLIIY